MRLQSRIDPWERGVVAGQSKRAHLEPLRTDEALDDAGREVVLIKGIGDRQGLPMIHVEHVWVSGQTGYQRRIRRGITTVGRSSVLISSSLVRTIVEEVGGDRLINAVANPDRGGGIH